MIIHLVLLIAGVYIVCGVDPWPLSMGIYAGEPVQIAMAMVAYLLLAEACSRAVGASRVLLATACVLLPLIPTTSPTSTVHETAWIIMVLCGFSAWLWEGRSKAWLAAVIAWTVWLADATGYGSLGGDGQVIVIAGLAFGVLVLDRPVRSPQPS